MSRQRWKGAYDNVLVVGSFLLASWLGQKIGGDVGHGVRARVIGGVVGLTWYAVVVLVGGLVVRRRASRKDVAEGFVEPAGGPRGRPRESTRAASVDETPGGTPPTAEAHGADS